MATFTTIVTLLAAALGLCALGLAFWAYDTPQKPPYRRRGPGSGTCAA